MVLADLVLELDGRPVALTLTRVETPSIDEMRDGSGTIEVRAVGNVEDRRRWPAPPGLRNNHQPAASVYLANALIPEDREVSVVGQSRDPRQQEFASNTTFTRDGLGNCYGWFSAPPEWRRFSGGVRLWAES